GKLSPSAIILLAFGAIFEFWILFALINAALKKNDRRPYYLRVVDALKCQCR
ncbi:hypothetical protein GQ44DRAFT_630393, partial [Phaeosphaeriaceae sp. PMI808]